MRINANNIKQRSMMKNQKSFMEYWNTYKAKVDDYMTNLFRNLPENPYKRRLVQSMLYACSSKGKRFRPILSLTTAKTLDLPEEKTLPFAAAIELVHSYSLIHDDLPCLDNEDWRRGQPSHHKVYGEALSLLSGNALMNMAFEMVTRFDSAQAKKATQVLVKAIGTAGMLGGQAMDIQIKKQDQTKDQITILHWNKTGVLIEAAVSGPAYIFSCNSEVLSLFTEYGKHLGLAFQMADDILDKGNNNYAQLFSEKEAKEELKSLTESAISALQPLGPRGEYLKAIAQYNHNRVTAI